jgi:predicted ribosomally synthesized peptide with SipW-like signal peptide
MVNFYKKKRGIVMLDVVMVGIFILLVASMASLASWSDKVVKEGKQS